MMRATFRDELEDTGFCYHYTRNCRRHVEVFGGSRVGVILEGVRVGGIQISPYWRDRVKNLGDEE